MKFRSKYLLWAYVISITSLICLAVIILISNIKNLLTQEITYLIVLIQICNVIANGYLIYKDTRVNIYSKLNVFLAIFGIIGVIAYTIHPTKIFMKKSSTSYKGVFSKRVWEK